MNLQQELQTAKSVIADQQIALRLQQEQLSQAYFVDPDGKLVHGRCGEEGLSFHQEPYEVKRVCPCFKE